VSVTFTAPTTGVSGTFASSGCTSNTPTTTCVATTAANGQATSSTFTANANSGGPYTVTGSAAGATTSASFSLFNNSANLTLAPTSGHAGGTVGVSGTGWTHSSTLTATFNGSPVTLTTGTTASNGQISSGCAFTVPTIATGTYLVIVTDGGGRKAAVQFTVN
jgi:hypothetical protein